MAFVNWEPKEKRRARARTSISTLNPLVMGALPEERIGANLPAVDFGAIGKRASRSLFKDPASTYWADVGDRAAKTLFKPDPNVPGAIPNIDAATQVPAATSVPADSGSGYRIVQGPKGPILTNVGGNEAVINQVEALRDTGIAAVLPSGDRISSMRRGSDLSALGDKVYNVSPNIHTDQPHHGTPGVIGGERVGDARPDAGGNADTLAHLQAVQSVLGLSTLGEPLSPSQIAGSPVTAPTGAPTMSVMPPEAAIPAISAENTFGDIATAFSATAPGGEVPLAGGALSQEQLNTLGASLATGNLQTPVITGDGSVQQMVPSGELTYEDALARGYDLAGKPQGWAGAIVAGNQARGYAQGQLSSIARNRKMAMAEGRAALDLSKFGLEEEKFAAGAPGREAETALKTAQVAASTQKTKALANFSKEEFKQFIMGSKSKKAIDAKDIRAKALEIAEIMQNDPKYEGLSFTDIHALAAQALTEQQKRLDKGETATFTPAVEAESGLFGFGGTEAIPASVTF